MEVAAEEEHKLVLNVSPQIKKINLILVNLYFKKDNAKFWLTLFPINTRYFLG